MIVWAIRYLEFRFAGPLRVTISLRRAPGRNARVSRHQQEIVLFLQGGLQYKQIAEKLGISLATVTQHIHNIYARLNADSSVALNKLFHH